mgnify:FL=1
MQNATYVFFYALYLAYCATNAHLSYKNNAFLKKSRKTLKKIHLFYLRIKNYTYICSRREDKNLYLMCFSQQNATKNNRIAFFFVILLD